jgi:hypothetical protein
MVKSIWDIRNVVYYCDRVFQNVLWYLRILRPIRRSYIQNNQSKSRYGSMNPMMSTRTNCHYMLDTDNPHSTCSRRPGSRPPALPRGGRPTDSPRERWRPWCAPCGHVGAYAVSVGRGSSCPGRIDGASALFVINILVKCQCSLGTAVHAM